MITAHRHPRGVGEALLKQRGSINYSPQGGLTLMDLHDVDVSLRETSGVTIF